MLPTIVKNFKISGEKELRSHFVSNKKLNFIVTKAFFRPQKWLAPIKSPAVKYALSYASGFLKNISTCVLFASSSRMYNLLTQHRILCIHTHTPILLWMPFCSPPRHFLFLLLFLHSFLMKERILAKSKEILSANNCQAEKYKTKVSEHIVVDDS